MILFIILLTAAVNILLGILCYKKNPRSDTNRLLSVLAFIFACWTIANYFSLHSVTERATLFWIQTVMFITTPMGPILYLFIKAFPRATLAINKKLFIILILVTSLLMSLAYTPFIFSGVSIKENITPTPGPGALLFGILLMGSTAAAFLELFQKYKKSFGIEKQQLKFLTFGTIVTFGLLILTNFILVVAFKISDYVIFGPIFSLIFVGFISYAIVKHRLLAIHLIVIRSVTFTVLILILAAIYTFGVFIISRYLFETEISRELQLSSLILAIFIVLTFDRLKNIVEKATDKIFFRRTYKSDELILELTTLVASTYKLKTLTQKTLHKLLETFYIERGAFVIYRKQNRYTIVYEGYKTVPLYDKDILDEIYTLRRMIIFEEEQDKHVKSLMQRINMVIALPLSEHGESEGLLLLGSKKSGELYTPQDIKLLEIFGPVISLAIQNAKSYEEIRSFNKTLSDKITIATKELQASHEKLQILDKQKDKFLGMASHELKTPITSIKAFTQVLQRKLAASNDKVYQKLLENITIQTDRVTKLINDLLNVSNIEAGKLVLKKEKISFDDLVTKTINEIQYISDHHKIIKIGKTNKEIMGDADRIEQVISNLLTNAIKYSPRADKVMVSLSEDNKNVILSVTDFGHGINKEDQTKIFKRFYRSREHEEKNISGFGLGLYIVAEIIKRHGGRIWVDSNKKKGSRFSFSLPYIVTH